MGKIRNRVVLLVAVVVHSVYICGQVGLYTIVYTYPYMQVSCQPQNHNMLWSWVFITVSLCYHSTKHTNDTKSLHNIRYRTLRALLYVVVYTNIYRTYIWYEGKGGRGYAHTMPLLPQYQK